MKNADIEVKMDIDAPRIQTRARNTFEAIKILLKIQVAKDCNLNAPMKKNFLRNSALRTAALRTDTIVWDTPYAHFQHEGRVMVGEHSGSPWAMKGERKIYTNRPLTYTNGGDHWIQKTFAQRHKAWEDLARSLFKKGFNR